MLWNIYEDRKEKMTTEQKEYLLNLARKSIDYYLFNKTNYFIQPPQDSELLEERAVFVTLQQKGALRGCIGYMQPRGPLYKAVTEMAVAAAFDDPRFSQLRETDLNTIKIEISILSVMQKISNYQEIELGVDGVLIRKSFNSGVFLPQVASETGWDLTTFLANLCTHKAGLSPDAYLDPETEIFIFQVEKFSEK
jgi:AmmeMemoRadiSam system protein A